MKYRALMGLGAVVLLAAAAATIDAPPIGWQPPWALRLALAGGGVLLACAALLVGRSQNRSG